MNFISPSHLLCSMACSGVSMGFEKMKSHLHLSAQDIKNALTPRNIAYGILSATVVTGILANPVSRAALCSFLSMSCSMTLILFQLSMMGLFLAWKGFQGLKSIAGYGVPKVAAAASALVNNSGVNVKDVVQSVSPLASSISPTPNNNILESAWKESAFPLPDSQEKYLDEATKVLEDYEMGETHLNPSVPLPHVDNASLERVWTLDEATALLEEYENEGVSMHCSVPQNSSIGDSLPFKSISKTEELVSEYLSQPSLVSTEIGTLVGNVGKWANDFTVNQWVDQFEVEKWAEDFVEEGLSSVAPRDASFSLARGLAVGAAAYSIWKLYNIVRSQEQETRIGSNKEKNLPPVDDQEKLFFRL